jgi:2-polyprenyl-6-methoxyphenol hydroxylase-like FAD-dependent oxidoreductase
MRARAIDGKRLLPNPVDLKATVLSLLDQATLQAHRGHLHSQLKEIATSLETPGIPAAIHTSSRISKVDPENATITLANGEVVYADLIIGADGVRSITRKAAVGSAYDSFDIGKSAIRFMVPRDRVLADPETREVAGPSGAMDFYFTESHKVVIYQCVENTLLNIVCIHPSYQSDASAETYNKSVSKREMLDIFKDFSETLLKVFSMCDGDTLKVYPLLDAQPLPTFIRNRLALVGDAAHPFTPFLGQGGATAIEDAVALGVMLSRGVTRADVKVRLELYNLARRDRANLIQHYSRMAGGDGVKPGDEKEARMKSKFSVNLNMLSLSYHNFMINY